MIKVGVALAVHNSCRQTKECLEALFKSDHPLLHVVVVDDGSTDDTAEMLQAEFPQVVVLHGDGNLWWTGATNLAVRACLEAGCEYVLLLNPDVLLQPNTINTLVRGSQQLDQAIVSPIVLDFDHPDQIWEAGHTWEPVIKQVPILWVSRYLYRHGALAANIPHEPYKTVSVVGRGGLIPRAAFERLGLFDEKHLPHYGADADMAVRAWRAEYPMYIIPGATVLLHTRQTGMTIPLSFVSACRRYGRYLFSRKYGERVRVFYYLNVNNLPLYAALPNYVFMLGLNTLRYWQRFFRQRRRHEYG